MASQTRPFLMTGAALASAAAVIAATPVIAPSITGSSLSISHSSVNLATFADILTIPADEWVTALFQGYGGIVGPNNPIPGDPSQTGGLEPWASGCNAACFVYGPSGVAYLALDALINGNGQGWNDNQNWGVGAVNYFFEGGSLGAGTEWLLQESVGASNPILAVAITLFFTGPQLVTVVFDNAIQLLGDAALNLPLVGQYVAGALNAYLGPASLYAPFQVYTPGLSGVLNYGIDVVLGKAPVIPTAAASSAAALAVAPAAAALTTRAAEKAVEASPAAAPTAADVAASTEVESATADKAAEAATGESDADATPASAEPTAVTATESTAAETTPADVKPSTGSASDAVAATTETATGAPDTKPADSSAKSRKRPLRDAVEKVATGIGSALKGTKSGDTAGVASAADEKPAAAADSAS